MAASIEPGPMIVVQSAAVKGTPVQSKIRQDYTSSSSVERRPGEYATRRLKIYAFDPQLGRRREHRISIELPFEPLEPGPRGRLVSVVDYDATSNRYYKPVDLDDPRLLAAGGLEPNVGDPQFHQQMAYGVAMKVVSNFERALGRRLREWGPRNARKPLTILPHAFAGRNAFFDPDSSSLCFGYFRADEDDPGENIPGQLIFSCLSHDIVAHEMAHAIVHQLRPSYNEATNDDVFAFHEAIADIVAIFQHFSFPGVLSDAVQQGAADLSRPGPLIQLARQFGQATGGGEALRTARDREDDTPDPSLYRRTFEPHDRASILVRAVFDAFFATYGVRVQDLLRLATGGSGIVGEGALHPDLVNRVSGEAADTAQRVLDLCIRAFEYLPPVDVTFSDFLRALVTADTDLNPDDPLDLRANLVDSFLARGIYPEDVISLNQESLMWPVASDLGLRLEEDILDQLLIVGAHSWGIRSSPTPPPLTRKTAIKLHEFAETNAEALGLVAPTDDLPISVRGYHSVFRVGSDGQLLTEASIQFVQTHKVDDPRFAGLPQRGGSTVVFSGDGVPRYIITKPLPDPDIAIGAGEEAVRRREATLDFIDRCDQHDPFFSWADADYPFDKRMLHRFSFALVHQGIRRSRRREA
jgi:hypothetical protein